MQTAQANNMLNKKYSVVAAKRHQCAQCERPATKRFFYHSALTELDFQTCDHPHCLEWADTVVTRLDSFHPASIGKGVLTTEPMMAEALAA